MQNFQMKLTRNVLRWLTLTTSLVLLTNLSGCASIDLFGTTQKPIEVVDKPIEKTPLDLALPDPVDAKAFKWAIVTRANAEQIFSDLEKRGENVVLFAVTDSGYQQLSITVAEMRNLIAQYRNIVIKYKEYYEPAKPVEKK